MALPALIEPETPPAQRLDTLPAWPWDILDPTAPPTLGWHAIAWAEGWGGFPGLPDGWRGLTQPNGPRAGRSYRVTSRQKRFLLWFYALDADAQWVYSAAIRRLAKGSGKSPFAAVHALTEFLGPVRLATFRRGAPGGVEGMVVGMPLVQIAATAATQTQNTMRYVRAYAAKGSHVASFYNLDVGKTQYYRVPEGTLEVITSSVSASEGAESTFVVEDEQEHWRPGNNGPQLAATIEDNLAKSGARPLGTSNAWSPGQESVAEAMWAAWIAQEEGRTQALGTRILYDAVIAPPKVELADPVALQEALEVVYEDCDWKYPHEPDPDRPGDARRVPGSKPDVHPILRRIYHVASLPSDSKRKYLNRPEAPELSWVTTEQWEAMYDPARVVAEQEDVVMFFDGSRTRDATALVGCTLEDGHIFTIGIWEPDRSKGQSVDMNSVDLAVARAFRTWNVVGFFGDVNEWESFVKVEWPRRYGDQLKVRSVVGGQDPQPIAFDMRGQGHGRSRQFTAACELVRAEIKEGLFTHDGHPVLARHVANAREYENRYGVAIAKESRDSVLKIDGCVCTIGARMVRQLALAAGASAKPVKSKTMKAR
jgi:hypothetical protein